MTVSPSAVATGRDAPQRTSRPARALSARGVPPGRPGPAITGPEMAAQVDDVFPCWIVWWGEYTQEFWAIPIPGRGLPCPQLRAATAPDLVGLIRRADARRGGLPGPALRPAARSDAGSGGAAAHGGER